MLRNVFYAYLESLPSMQKLIQRDELGIAFQQKLDDLCAY